MTRLPSSAQSNDAALDPSTPDSLYSVWFLRLNPTFRDKLPYSVLQSVSDATKMLGQYLSDCILLESSRFNTKICFANVVMSFQSCLARRLPFQLYDTPTSGGGLRLI